MYCLTARSLPTRGIRSITWPYKGRVVGSNIETDIPTLICKRDQITMSHIVRPGQLIINRLYHCKTSVYGFNAALQHKRKSAALDYTSHGFDGLASTRAIEANLYRFVEAYRKHGHKIASTNPARPPISEISPNLTTSYYSLDPSKDFSVEGILYCNSDSMKSLEEITQYLKQVYCGGIALDVNCVNSDIEQEWLYRRFEELNETTSSFVVRSFEDDIGWIACLMVDL